MKRKRKRLDPFACHEVYDRASIVLEMFAEYVAEHPVVEADKALSKKAQKVIDVLYDFYRDSAVKLMPHASPDAKSR